MNKLFEDYRSIAAQLLHKDGITNFHIEIQESSAEKHKCQVLIHDNEIDENFELIVVRGKKDIELLMPLIVKKIKELRDEKATPN